MRKPVKEASESKKSEAAEAKLSPKQRKLAELKEAKGYSKGGKVTKGKC